MNLLKRIELVEKTRVTRHPGSCNRCGGLHASDALQAEVNGRDGYPCLCRACGCGAYMNALAEFGRECGV